MLLVCVNLMSIASVPALAAQITEPLEPTTGVPKEERAWVETIPQVTEPEATEQTAAQPQDEERPTVQTLPPESETGDQEQAWTEAAGLSEPEAEQQTQATEPEQQTQATEPEQQTQATEPEQQTQPTEPELQSVDAVPLYFQTDYPDTLYGSGTIETSGCSITSLAMVATYMTGHVYMPDELAGYFGGYVGNNMERLEYASTQLQLPWKKAENWHESLRALQEGKLVIVLMNSKSAFTQSQHFMVLTGLTEDGKVLVNDPYEPNYDHWALKDGFANGFPQGYISTGYSGSWIYDVDAMPEEPFIYYEEPEPEVECRYPGLELSQEDKTLLAKMIWVEAQGEPVEGQQAVAEVVLNRLVADDFPDTIKSVIYAENQFRSADFLEDAEDTQTQYEAIDRALNGPYVLPIDVVFFATYPVTENVWGEIGGHVFCYRW